MYRMRILVKQRFYVYRFADILSEIFKREGHIALYCLQNIHFQARETTEDERKTNTAAFNCHLPEGFSVP